MQYSLSDRKCISDKKWGDKYYHYRLFVCCSLICLERRLSGLFRIMRHGIGDTSGRIMCGKYQRPLNYRSLVSTISMIAKTQHDRWEGKENTNKKEVQR